MFGFSFFQTSEWKELISKISHPQSFIRNFSISSFWNALIILSQFILSPVLSRIFAPSEYGLYAIYSSLVFSITLVGSLKYGEAIVLQQARERKNQLIAICLLLTVVTAALTALIFWWWGDAIGVLLNENRIVPLLYFIPVTVLIMGCYDALLSINISEKLFFRNGMSGFGYNAGARLISITLGVFRGAKGSGLVWGDLLGRTLGVSLLLLPMRDLRQRAKNFFADWNWTELKRRVVEYKSFPLYYLPSGLLLILTAHMPLYFFQFKFDSSVVGSFGMANSILDILNRLIPYSLAPIFLQKASELKLTSVELLRSKVNSFFVVMLILSTLVFSFFALTGQFLFSIALGENWSMAGQFASILSLQFVINFLTIALTEVFNVMGRQKLLLGVTLCGVAAKVLALIFISFSSLDIYTSLLIFSIVSALSSMAVVTAAFVVIKGSPWRPIFWQFGSLVIVLMFYIVGRTL